MKKCFVLLALIISSIAAKAQGADSVSSTKEIAVAVLWTRTSGEYKALSFQAYNFAKISMDNAMKHRKSNKPKCVIVDIDETVLDNSAYYEYMVKEKKPLVWESWKNWLLTHSADTVPGAVNFLRYAASKNVEVFYVTNREEVFTEITMIDLKKYHFPDANLAHYFPSRGIYNKDPRREEIAKTHEILLLAGDNLSDFSSIFYSKRDKVKDEVEIRKELFGIKFIVLPNSMYGNWKPKK
jgi:5'-nucleotidase (lipoprotein e(P4) family)